MAQRGYVYVLVNDQMPGLVKVGKSIHGGRRRAKEIYTTGVPAPFRIHFEMYCEDAEWIEKEVHRQLQVEHMRPNERREFFECAPDYAEIKIINAYVEYLWGVSLEYHMIARGDCGVEEYNTTASMIWLHRNEDFLCDMGAEHF